MPRTNPKPRLGRPPKTEDAAYSRAIRAQLRPDTDDALRELAAGKQQTLSDYIRRVLETHVRSVQAGRAASKPSQGE